MADGDLARVEHGRTVTGGNPYEPQPFHAQLLHYARNHRPRPYNDGWAAHKFKEKFGYFPPRSWNRAAPIPPAPPVQSWIRSRLIAYARSLDPVR